MSIRAGARASSPTGCSRSATVSARSPAVSAAPGTTPLSSCSPSSVAGFARTAMAAPITATAMSSGSRAAASAAGPSTAARAARVSGDWPGLATPQLYQGRDLAVTTNYRVVLAAILERHLRLDDRALMQVFPDLPPARSNLREMLAA